MQMKKLVVGLITVFSLLFFLPAQEMTLTVEDACAIAMKENVSIKRSQIQLNQKERNSKYSWNSVSPSVSANASVSKPLPGETGSDKSTVSAGISLRSTFTSNLYSSIQSSRLVLEQQQISYEDACRTVELNVRQVFYYLLYQSENISIQEKALETAKQQYDSNLARYNRGLLSRLDVLNAQVSYQNAKLNVDSLKTDYDSSVKSFLNVLGLPSTTSLKLSGSFDSVLGLRKISLEGKEINSPGIKSLENQIQSAENSVLASRFSAYGPSLTATYSYNGSSTDGGENWNNGGSLSIAASIPLDGVMPWSSSHQNVESAKDNLADLKLQLKSEEENLQIEIEKILGKISQIQNGIELRKSSINLAQSSYKMTLESYNHGTRDLLALQTAHDNLLQSKVSLLQEAYNLISQILQLEYICGFDFGSLEN